MIGWFEAVLLGVVQGLTEFLPISSTAHILIVSQLFGWEDPGAAFTAVTQLGTESAVLVYFRKDIARIIATWTRSLFSPPLRSSIDARMGWYVIIGTLPIGVFGFAFRDQIETVARNLWLVAGTLIAFGVILGLADRLGAKEKGTEALSARDGVLFGFGQALALIPGVSRSGATISAGLALGYRREAATRYAFLLAIPAVVISGLFEALKIGYGSAPQWGPTILATLIAFVVGYSVIAWLLRYITTHSYLPFVAYRIALGLLIIVLLGFGVLTTA
ncbi:MAG: undecaprenyl-diphosphate phosphatase [Candidatus Nanopelagicales bacterium]|nr:undecaprenyl-diphosphate phosphatase [Candidatus Nanopelagicales bacterium]